MATITHGQAKRFYDRLGAAQDTQAFYERPAVDAMVAHGDFGAAHAVCEIGCGTGRLAARLLADHLPPDATYLGLDVSETMVALTRERVTPWAARATILRTDGEPRLPVADGSLDRVVAAYVLDLLSVDDIRTLLADARRALRSGGLLCNAGLTFGRGPMSRALSRIWRAVHAWRPTLVGGCRPLELEPYLAEGGWATVHREVVCRFGVCSEVIVARAPDPP